MPELPEVEVLVRHLAPLLKGQVIHSVQVRRAKVLKPTSVARFTSALQGARFTSISRRGKYLLFTLQPSRRRAPLTLLGHLGMTGRMYLARTGMPLPKHAAVVLNLARQKLIYEDTRYFGRFTLDTSPLARLGPEPLDSQFTVAGFAHNLSRSAQAIKVKLLDQSIVAGVGNIYASEALFRARISPCCPSRKLDLGQARRLRRAIRQVLTEAIACGSTLPLNYGGDRKRDRLFYFGRTADAPDFYSERLQVYDRADKPCNCCGTLVKRLIQAARSTFYCPRCQPRSSVIRKIHGQETKKVQPPKQIDASWVA